MCNHVFKYPLDIKENYNPDGKTLTGVCKYCGAKKRAYGMRGALPIFEKFEANSFRNNMTKLQK